MMNTKTAKLYTIVFLVFGTGVLYLLNRFLSPYHMQIINLIGINIILVVSLNLSNGFCGIFSLGHAGFMAVGAYVTAILTIPAAKKFILLPQLPGWLASLQLPFLFALLLGGLVASICALVIGYPVLRLRGHYLSVATLGFLVIIQVFITQMDGLTRGARGLNGLESFTNVWWIWFGVILTIYIVAKVIHSAYGRGMIAVKEDELAAECLGVNLTSHKLLAFCLSAFFAGIGGALWGHLITVITPGSFSYSQTFNLVVMSVVGGMSSITGGVVGALLMTLIPELLRNLESGITLWGINLPPLYGLSQIILAIALILVILFRPNGLLGRLEFSWTRLQIKSLFRKGGDTTH
ncbi:MAG TPA: branched-chain amino acid ABC transporter permease [Firmicutes bacterium]|jgi:branched-chain amino acid transport system permease protein|nr:branched-chain amino acid ABC transporter permease [Bacillota bacterium]